MTIEQLEERKLQLQQSLANIQQSFHMVTGHIHEIDFQIKSLIESAPAIEKQIESPVE